MATNTESRLTADTIYGFSGSVLSQRFDNAMETPEFHREMWEMCCSSSRYVAIAAPRGHAKSTAITHSYVLANLLFRERQYVLIVSDTEGQAKQFLHDIKTELTENDAIKELFGVDKFLKDTETDIVVQMKERNPDGSPYVFRVIAKGSEQKVRGLKWLGKRPDLVVCDDLENEDLTANPDRRLKFRQWFYGALLPVGSDRCIFRVVGTILHLDSLLERLLNDDTWNSRRYEAHNEDFSKILWGSKFPRERLEQIRQGYINQGFPEGYYQEYLNVPIDPTNAYFQKRDFLPMEESDFDKPKTYYSAIDFAISKSERADRTVTGAVGVDNAGILYVEDVRIGRWDSKEIVDEMFSVHKRYDPDLYTTERGMIEKAIGPYLTDEMFKRNQFIPLNPMQPTKDKEARARSIQARLRAGGVRFNKEAEWYPELEHEMLTFPKGKHDDIVDFLAWIGLTLDRHIPAPTVEELEEEAWEEEWILTGQADDGRNWTTGY